MSINIYKYRLFESGGDRVKRITLKAFARPLHVTHYQGAVHLWAEVKAEGLPQDWEFFLVRTGESPPCKFHVGTVIINDNYVAHIYGRRA